MEYTREYFDAMPNRRGSLSTKWDGCNAKFGLAENEEMIPMWIADMDFYSPREVIDELTERARFGCYGYTVKSDGFYDAIVNWVERRYGWKIEREWIVTSPGVIPGLHIAIQTLTAPGDGIIVQTPVYYPFMTGVEINGRRMVNNRLVEKDGRWTIDFDDLERKAADPATTMMIFCNPHNPVGRAWTAEEVSRVVEICASHGVTLLSDEIHADLIMPGHVHSAACAVRPDLKNACVTYYAPSKTFNLAGLQTAFAVVPDDELRAKYEHGLNVNRIFNVSWFGEAALRTAYTKCDGYVGALCDYVSGNMDLMKRFLDERLPRLKMVKPEATYMTWVDFRGSGMTVAQIEEFIVKKARIGVDMGSWFGPGGEGWLRFNLACPRALVEKALLQLEAAFNHR